MGGGGSEGACGSCTQPHLRLRCLLHEASLDAGSRPAGLVLQFCLGLPASAARTMFWACVHTAHRQSPGGESGALCSALGLAGCAESSAGHSGAVVMGNQEPLLWRWKQGGHCHTHGPRAQPLPGHRELDASAPQGPGHCSRRWGLAEQGEGGLQQQQADTHCLPRAHVDSVSTSKAMSKVDVVTGRVQVVAAGLDMGDEACGVLCLWNQGL